MKYYTIGDGNENLKESKSTTITADSLEHAERVAKSIYKTDKSWVSFQEKWLDEDEYYS